MLAVTVRRPGESQCVSPAHAGVEGPLTRLTRQPTCQPRARGSRGPAASACFHAFRSVLRTLGWRRQAVLGQQADRVSPAYAGVYIDMRLTLPGLGQLPRAPTARGSGAIGGGLGLLHRGRRFVQYAQPSVSRSPPSWSVPARGGRTGTVVEPAPGGRAGARNGWAGVRRRKVRRPLVRAPGSAAETTQDLAESSPSAAQCPRC